MSSAAQRAEKAEPAVPDRHVPDLVAQDHIDDLRRRFVAGRGEFRADRRGSIEAARLERPGHKRHAGKDVAGSPLRHLPQAIVRGKVAVGSPEGSEPLAEEAEVRGLLVRHAQPVQVVRLAAFR